MGYWEPFYISSLLRCLACVVHVFLKSNSRIFIIRCRFCNKYKVEHEYEGIFYLFLQSDDTIAKKITILADRRSTIDHKGCKSCSTHSRERFGS